jgi:Raf kinase inhibitor-like YbhB/YbcL family protein
LRVFEAEEHIMYKKILTAGIIAFGALSASGAFAQGMKLTSGEVSDGSTIKDAQVANVFGCKGGNSSPSLSWSGAPSDTKSFAITVYDPDAPTGSGFWHWVVFNIPASTTSIPLDAGDIKKKLMPKGAIQSRTDFGTDGYGGPCPPQGDKPHHYIFTVYAVDEDKLQYAKDHNVSAAVVGFELHFHSKDKASLTATYGR